MITDSKKRITGKEKIITTIEKVFGELEQHTFNLDKETKQEILHAIEQAFDMLEMQKFALDQAAIVATTDLKGSITYVNDKFCDISGYSAEELIGQNHRILKSGYHTDEFYENLWTTIASGKVWSGQIKNKAKNGALYWVHTTIIPFYDGEPKPYQYLSIRFDITEQKELEFQLEQRVAERTHHLQEANEKIQKIADHLTVQKSQLEDFCNIVSHNLRSPLVNLTMLVDFIKESETEKERMELIDKFKPVIDSLNETFGELVESLQISQDVEIKSEKIDLNHCLEKTLFGFNGQVLATKAVITSDFSAAPVVVFPLTYMRSIFHNLTSNALKYYSPDRPPRIHFSTKREGNKVTLSVKDNGLGIDLVKQKDKLFKIRKVFHNHPDAKGFGLFITKAQMDAMNGRIWIESAVDKGSTFFVEFNNQ